MEKNGILREILKRMEYLEKYGKNWNIQRNIKKNGILREIIKRMEYLEKYGKELNIKRNMKKRRL